MADEKGARVFSITREEVASMMLANCGSIEEAIAKVTKGEAEEDVADIKANFADVLDSLRQQLEETQFLAKHLAPGPYVMTAAELVAFRRVYGPLRVDMTALRFKISAQQERRAERSMGASLIAVPRPVLPADLVKG